MTSENPSDVIGVKKYRVAQFFVRGEYEYESRLKDEVESSSHYSSLKNPEYLGDIKLVRGRDGMKEFVTDEVSTVCVDTDAEPSDEPVYLVSVKYE